jgi:formate--tetrahydrofolate ligase
MSQPLRPIAAVADALGIRSELLIPYGTYKAKVQHRALAESSRSGRLILVSAITPTPAGEGKTVTSIGLAQGLQAIGEKVCLALREPSLGPVFGLKGGATGGGQSRVEPWEDINLHFNGDFHAISAANNLLAAILDNHLHHGNALGIDPRRVTWRRAIDLNDRSLRQTLVGLGGASQGVPRETGFDITPASEIMAVLCLATDFDDLRLRLGRMLVGYGYDKRAITAADLKAQGALLVLLKDAFLPNLVQTTEGVPAFVHGGPFANIAHGCNSVLATRMALAHGDWAVTEAGFAFDLGGEKFIDIKCRAAGLDPAAIVLVATVRALKMHGGAPAKTLEVPDLAALERGFANLEKHVENARFFGREPVVAINRFPGDSEEELAALEGFCAKLGILSARSEVFARGGEGGRDLATKVVAQAAKATLPCRPLYDLDLPLDEKVRRVAIQIYGADGVVFSPEAQKAQKQIEKLGYGQLPVCMAKTQKSISDDPGLLGRPRGFEVKIRDFVLSAGAGFVVALAGEILRMPGLPKTPQSDFVDLVDGEIVGLG